MNHSERTAHFLHIGKTGGSAIKSVLEDYKAVANYRIVLHEHDTVLDDIPPGEKVFFCLRDPISRFVSGFYSRKRKGQPRYYSEWSDFERQVFETFETPNDLAEALGAGTHRHHELAMQAMRGGVQHLGHSRPGLVRMERLNEGVTTFSTLASRKPLSGISSASENVWDCPGQHNFQAIR